jgi:hypothetical protein
LGWKEIAVLDMTFQLVNHYSRVRQELEGHRAELTDQVSSEYAQRMIEGLSHWIAAGKNGYLKWGIMHFQKGR